MPVPPIATLELPVITSLIVVVLFTVSDELPAMLNVAGVVKASAIESQAAAAAAGERHVAVQRTPGSPA